MVDEIIGRLPELTGHNWGASRMSSGASASAGLPLPAGASTLPVSRRTPRRPSRKFWSTVPTRTVICSLSYAATYVVTAPPASVDPTRYFQFHEGVSLRSST
jgi:hypothetical protein